MCTLHIQLRKYDTRLCACMQVVRAAMAWRLMCVLSGSDVRVVLDKESFLTSLDRAGWVVGAPCHGGVAARFAAAHCSPSPASADVCARMYGMPPSATPYALSPCPVYCARSLLRWWRARAGCHARGLMLQGARPSWRAQWCAAYPGSACRRQTAPQPRAHSSRLGAHSQCRQCGPRVSCRQGARQ